MTEPPIAAERFVVATSYFPPIVGGTSTVLRVLLGAFEPASFAVVAEEPASIGGTHGDDVPTDMHVERLGVPGWLRYVPLLNRSFQTKRYALAEQVKDRIVAQIKRLDAQRIIAIYPSWPFMIGAYLAHLETGLPLVTYYMDTTLDDARLGANYVNALHQYEAAILQAATARLVLVPTIAEDLQSRYGVDCQVISHAIEPSPDHACSPLPKLPFDPATQPMLVHTGVVEYLQCQGLMRLVKAIDRLPELGIQLVLSTPTPAFEIAHWDLKRPWIHVMQVSRPEVRALQRHATLAIAALPFDDGNTLQKTSYPTKVVEYMDSGAPVLALAPLDGFFGRHVTEHGYACLVDTDDPEVLAGIITELLTDSARREALVACGRRTVQSEFTLPAVAGRFIAAAGIAPTALRPDYR